MLVPLAHILASATGWTRPGQAPNVPQQAPYQGQQLSTGSITNSHSPQPTNMALLGRLLIWGVFQACQCAGCSARPPAPAAALLSGSAVCALGGRASFGSTERLKSKDDSSSRRTLPPLLLIAVSRAKAALLRALLPLLKWKYTALSLRCSKLVANRSCACEICCLCWLLHRGLGR